VTNQVLLELEFVAQAPDLDDLVPASGDDGRLIDVWRELDAGNPISVSIVDDDLALTESVPQADGLVARTRDDLSVVGGEGNAQDVLGVSNETSVSLGLVQIPQSDGGIPRSRQGEVTILGDDNVLNIVVVATKSTVGITIFGVWTFSISTSDVPLDDSLISGRGQNHVRRLVSGGNACDPIAMAF